MAFDFPTAPSEGQVYSPAGGPKFVYYAPAWRQVTTEQAIQLPTAETRNRIVNPAMQISQENGDTIGSVSSYYPADQWMSINAGLTSFTTARQPSTPGTGQIYMAGVKATLASGDNVSFNQSIEGTRVADFEWGTATAKKVVLRFEAYSQFGGTFCVCIMNGAGDRSFLASFTLVAQTWKTTSISIPGDAMGTWPGTTAIGMYLRFVYACGSSYTGVAGWQAGLKMGLPGMTNGFAVQGANYIHNVGLYMDPNNTGVAPPFQVPDYADELRACQRYWRYSPSLNGKVGTATDSAIGGTMSPPMRVPPAGSIVAGATINVPYLANPAISALPAWGPDTMNIQTQVTHASTTAGQDCQMYPNNLKLSARM